MLVMQNNMNICNLIQKSNRKNLLEFHFAAVQVYVTYYFVPQLFMHRKIKIYAKKTIFCTLIRPTFAIQTLK